MYSRTHVLCIPDKLSKNTVSEYIVLLLYYVKNGYTNALQLYVKRVLILLFLYLHMSVKTSRSTNLDGHFPSPTNNNHTHIYTHT